ncbi:MAG TPA: leucine--tRNA ligase [Gemmatimonadales bacterium]|nr:leucine--tRNA ligase [Gemmatimonadales bacterium]
MTDRTAETAYDPQAVEAKWRARWAERRTNEPDLDRPAAPFYNLMMFPYPSAEGLHVGNMFAFTGADVYGRYQRLRGRTVFEPIGYDAFGIHSENYALRIGEHPGVVIPRNIANFRRQLERVGGMFDWRHTVDTTDPAYYKWTQWIFLELYKAGKAFKKKAAVNWCPNDKTVLANEQVEGGRCERCGALVEQRVLEQWFFRITDYAGRLLDNLDGLDWSDTTRTAQRNWIGRSDGAEVGFAVAGSTVRVYTTRPDTIFGATFLVLAPEHPLVDAITVPGQRAAVDAYRRTALATDVVSRRSGDRQKTGVPTGATAINPATGRPIPVWVADYVLMEYGTGAIMAVPGHDERDFEFATKYALPIVRVIAEGGSPRPAAFAAEPEATPSAAYTGGGRMVNSGEFDGLDVEAAKTRVTAWLESQGAGEGKTLYRLHDWCVSRQRYWGPPIPIIYCDHCGPQPVPERDLPVLLPPVEDFRPDDSGVSPLARHKEWYHVPCPACGREGRRETDVSDTFLDSAWYFLRYPSVGLDDRPFDPARTRRWLPVTSYIGGNEHAVLHLLYSRFIMMVLHELGHVEFEEPFTRFRAHGMIVKDGAKMSKTKGNIVVPDEYIAKWGADTFRTYLMFLGPLTDGGDFRDDGISGPRRFLDKLWSLVGEVAAAEGGASGPTASTAGRGGPPSAALTAKWHRAKMRATEGMEELRYNTSIAAVMELLNAVREEGCHHRALVEELVLLVAPVAPHFAEECWERLGHQGSVFDARWPAFDAALAVDDSLEVVVQVNGKTRSRITIDRSAAEPEVVAAALADPGVQRHLDGKAPKKTIYVPGRLVNLVV